MRPLLSILLLVLLVTLNSCKPSSSSDTTTTTSSGHGKEFKIDVARSELKWQVFKAGGSHQGIVPILDGSVFIDGNNITGGKVTLDMKNLQVTDLEGEDKLALEEHLKGYKPGKEDDFFNVNQYPTAIYVIKGSSPVSGDPEATHMVNGELTMRDITKPVAFKIKLDTGAGNAVKITAPQFSIDRTEWGIKFQSKKFFDNLKDDFVYDEIKLEMTVGAIQ
jgi:polyisoprenoid-binding protein YceI